MYKKWLCRRLPVVVFAIFIILYVDFQLRAGTNAPHARHSAAVQPRSSRHAQTAADTNSSSPASVPGPRLKLEQVFIAVKTTGRFHRTRLALLLQTWISKTKAQVRQVAGTENYSSVRVRVTNWTAGVSHLWARGKKTLIRHFWELFSSFRFVLNNCYFSEQSIGPRVQVQVQVAFVISLPYTQNTHVHTLTYTLEEPLQIFRISEWTRKMLFCLCFVCSWIRVSQIYIFYHFKTFFSSYKMWKMNSNCKPARMNHIFH